ncbi:MAG: hypothetical protein ACI8V8_000887 [Chitinophagales bacterium]|jgi:hypothetical protein
MEENFDKILREKLKNFEKSPPPGTFAAIQQKMKQPEKKEKRLLVLPIFVKYGLAASFAFLLGLLAMNWFSDFNNPNINTDNTVAVLEAPSIESNENKNPALFEKIESGLEEVGINSLDSVSTNLLNETIEAPLAKVYKKPEHVNSRPNLFVNNTENTSGNTEAVNGNSNNEEYLNDYMNYDDEGGKIAIDIKSKYAAQYQPKTDEVSTYALYNIENEVEDGLEVVSVEDVNSNLKGNNKKNKSNYENSLNGSSLSYDSSVVSNYTSEIRTHSLEVNENSSAEYLPFIVNNKKSSLISLRERLVLFHSYMGVDHSRDTSFNK